LERASGKTSTLRLRAPQFREQILEAEMNGGIVAKRVITVNPQLRIRKPNKRKEYGSEILTWDRNSLSERGSGEEANPNRECGCSRRHKGSVLREKYRIRIGAYQV